MNMDQKNKKDGPGHQQEIKELLKILPKKSGVYIFKNSIGSIIYIGKAKNLYNRVKSYFQTGGNSFLYMKPSDFAKQIKSIDYIITDSEEEALILEVNLIKKDRPKYNIEFKDDKSYPFIAVTVNEDFPRVFLTRNRNMKNAKYFGPYTDVKVVRKTLEYLRRIFKFRDCRKPRPGKGIKNPCLNHHIEFCSAPCIDNISDDAYRKNIEYIKLFLKGSDGTILSQLRSRMGIHAKKQEFEKAAELKKQIDDVMRLHQEQKIFLDSDDTWDCIAHAKEAEYAVISLFTYRTGTLALINNFIINNTRYLDDNEILSGFLKKYYGDINIIPSKIYIMAAIEDMKLLSGYFSRIKNKKVEIKAPLIGEKKKIMEMVARNSKLYLERKKFEKDTGHSEAVRELVKLKSILSLNNIPRRIECYDISNLKDAFSVGSMTVASDGELQRSDYRHFKIRGIKGQDDCAMLGEVVGRRITYLDGQKVKTKNSFYIKPDLLIIDGGKAQFNTIHDLLSKKKISGIDIISIAKKEEIIFSEKYKNGKNLNKDQGAMRIIIKLRDEAHRFAVNYHRKIRDRQMTRSLLDGISGIGEKKKQNIFDTIGSIDELKRMALEELVNIKGINHRDAINIYDIIHR